MGTVSVKRKIKILVLLVAGLILLSGGLISYGMIVNSSKTLDYRKVRVAVNQLEHKVEGKNGSVIQGEYIQADSGINGIMIIDLSGKVIFTQGETAYEYKETYPLKFLAGTPQIVSENNRITYEAPYLVENKMAGYLFIYLEGSNYYDGIRNKVSVLAVIWLLVLCGFIILWGINKTLDIYVFAPVNTLHIATRQIVNGNLEQPLLYDYEDEIGELCHDFEEMRSLLHAKNQIAIREKEKEKTLLACISHDLRTPLCGILGYVEGIRNHIVKDEKGIEAYSDIIIKKVNLLTKLIDDILEDTKTELNEMSFEFEEVYLKTYLESILSDLSVYAGREGVCLSVDEIPDLLVQVDPKRMQQVFYNLISNSVKYRKAKGNPAINIHFVKIKRKDKRELVISIEDNGIGIDAADLPFIFDKFYRGDKARSSKIAGSGLGLNIASYIVKKHGGEIECDSIRQVGTTISFSIPY